MKFYSLIILVLIKEQQNKGISAQTEQCSLTTSIKLQNELGSYRIKEASLGEELTIIRLKIKFMIN